MMMSRKRKASYPPRKERRAKRYRGFQPRSFARGEWKYLDTAINQPINTTGAQTLLNALAPGSGASQRIGMKVSIRSVQFRLFPYAMNGTGHDQFARLCIFLDRQSNGANPTLASHLSANNILAQRSLVERKRFKIIWDKTRVLNASGESGTAVVYTGYIKFRRPILVEFNSGVAGTISDIASNSMYLYTVGSIAAGATAGAVEGTVRIRYTDM